MTESLSIEHRQAQAAQTVRRFVRRFQPAYRALACHAALPLMLTPDLVNYLRNEFLRDEQVPWVAEVDLLLSDLCHPVGYELYAMDVDVRAYLLTELERLFGRSRMHQVAKVLISYVRYLAETNTQINPKELEAQQWAAMVYLNAQQRRAAVGQIVTQMQAALSGIDPIGRELVGQAEMTRLAQITAELAPELGEYPVLVDYATLVTQVILGDRALAAERLQRTYEVLPGYGLRVPEPLVTAALAHSSIGVESASLTQDWPELQPLEFITGQFVAAESESESESESEDSALDSVAPLALEPFEFDIATLELAYGQHLSEWQQGAFHQDQSLTKEWVIRRRCGSAQQWVERLGESLSLDMVAIPAGWFFMGPPKYEPELYGTERPQHEVTVPAFLMAKYPVTQAQWRFVAALPQINRELQPNPSHFKGDKHPVERVSWFDAVEFCARLSAHTGRDYRLPSEAEWEYACRAGTTTPFHFGEVITTEVANYDGRNTYNGSPKGEYRQTTTPVGQFGIANAFGLCDMHGNVWEWCQDHWHGNYEGAPTDGSAWLDADAEENKSRVIRGGSWFTYPGYCRSAYRTNDSPRESADYIGFRVVLIAPRALR